MTMAGPPHPPVVDQREPPARWRELAQRLLGAATLDSTGVEALTGYPREQSRRLWAALGLPPVPEGEAAFTEADVQIVSTVRVIVGDDPSMADVAVQLARVIGRAMARVADACVTTLAERAARAGDASDLGGGTRDAAVFGAVEAMGLTLEPVLAHVWRHHLLTALLRTTGAGDDDHPAQHVQAVGFADLVGFTALSQQLDAAELAALVDRFEALAYERIVGRGGRVVKMIGDEVMFAADDPATATEIALSLVEAPAHDRALPALRAGLALGPTLAWQGDLYGTTVNLASRLVEIARPGTVLVSDALGEALDPDAYDRRHLRPFRLKGLGRLRFWVIRHAGRGNAPEPGTDRG